MAYHRHHSFPSDVTHQEHQIGDDRRHRISSSSIPQLWKSYLYQLQQQAPTPKRIVCTREVLYRPFHYGREFHGRILREEADLLLQGGDGSYLVRESQRAPGQYTLSLRFGGMTKNYRLYYDGKHYVGEKKFHTVQDLVTDGLITLYLEANAGEYIAKMCVQSRYEQSPYMTLNSYKRKLQNMRVVKRRSMSNQGSKSNSLKSANECDRSEDGSINDGPVMAGLNVHRFEKPHNFKTHNFKGFPWCDLCGNFMWGIIAQGLKCEDCGFSAHRKCSENIPNDCLPDLKYVKRVFGIDLTTLVKAHNTPRPFVVDMCVKEIENRGLDAEGLYRVSGFSDEIEAVRLAFEKDGENADLSSTGCEDIHVITGVLKLFFRLLPIPLITYDTYPLFMNAVRKSTMEEKLDSIKEAVAKLPPAHYQTLKYLIQHLYRVTEKQKQNLMSIHNLGTVFCPTLMRTPDLISQPGQLSAWHQESLVIELLITHHRLLLDH
ncbi:N-chimaerin-like isoform X1 [Tachypleus tridentatus]|uniref:N-chimaerin-like isoform X1 n=2 Tax=Tachypleus tridentatus TaxID=6853 RepID=UPI003FD6108F